MRHERWLDAQQSAAGKHSKRGARCSPVQDGSLVDLLEQLQKDQAHLPVQDVLSIFFQVPHRCATPTAC